MYIQEGKDYVIYENNTLAFSNPQYIFNSIRDIGKMVTIDTPYLPPITMPFTSGLLAVSDDLVRNFLYSDVHRELIKSPEFARLSVPMLEKKIIDSVSNIEYSKSADKEEEFAPIMDSLFEVHAPMQYDTIERAMGIAPGDKVLEIGSATGNLAVRIAEDVSVVVGVDTSRPYNNIARKKAKKLGLDNCVFLDAEYPCRLEKDFDYVLCFGLNKSQTYSNFRGHAFPAEKVLLGGFRIKAFSDERENSELKKSLADFQNRYRVMPFRETRDDIGDKMDLDFIYLEKREH